MDRSATCLFGIRNYGVDINGYVRHPDKGLCLWFQKRAETKQTWPGKILFYVEVVVMGLMYGTSFRDKISIFFECTYNILGPNT